MMEVLKDQILKRFNLWLTEIEESKEGTTMIDITIEFERIFSRNIITISLGEDLGSEKIELNIPVDGSRKKFTKKIVSIIESMAIISDQLTNNV